MYTIYNLYQNISISSNSLRLLARHQTWTHESNFECTILPTSKCTQNWFNT